MIERLPESKHNRNYLAKPYRKGRLAATVRAALSNHGKRKKENERLVLHPPAHAMPMKHLVATLCRDSNPAKGLTHIHYLCANEQKTGSAKNPAPAAPIEHFQRLRHTERVGAFACAQHAAWETIPRKPLPRACNGRQKIVTLAPRHPGADVPG
ncbi:MAG TPA: hypothetical protein VGE72_11275 [Azospirillum sp.]